MTEIDPLLGRSLPPPSRPAAQPQVRRSRRRHPAAGARAVAAGLGATTMFGLVATMGIAHAYSLQAQSAGTAPIDVGTTPTPTIGAVVAPMVAPAVTPTVAPAAPGTTGAPAADTTVPAPAAAAAPAPIVLQARPDVRVVTPAPAPASAPAAAVAVTSGSG